jgi:hypothetical protein
MRSGTGTVTVTVTAARDATTAASGAGHDQPRIGSFPGPGQISAAGTARPAQSGRAAAGGGRSTAAWCRGTSSPAFSRAASD